MKCIVILSFLIFAQSVYSKEIPIEQFDKENYAAISKFLRQVIKVSEQQNLDSLEIVFSNFTREKIESNRLDDGHSILTQLENPCLKTLLKSPFFALFFAFFVELKNSNT